MGQRSQIYVSYRSGRRDENGHILDKTGGLELCARYYGWNYGARMVSRAVAVIDILSRYNRPDISGIHNKIIRICDVNFDMRDIVESADIIRDAEEECDDGGYLDYIFLWQANNDGKLFVKVCDDGSIHYAFTDSAAEKPMTAEEYMAWREYDTEEEDGSNYSKNCEFIAEKAMLMTPEELHDFMQADYCNVPKEEKIETVNAYYTGGGVYIYNGKLSDGNYFMTADNWEGDGDILIIDADPDPEEESEFPDWQERHKVKEITGQGGKRLWNEMIRLLIANDKSNARLDGLVKDMEKRIKE